MAKKVIKEISNGVIPSSVFTQSYLTLLNKMSVLLNEYDIIVSFADVESPGRCIELIQKKLLWELSEGPIEAIRRGNIKLLRLAETLDISREQLTAALGMAMAQTGEHVKALELCNELLRSRITPDLAKSITKIIIDTAKACTDSPGSLVSFSLS